MNKLLKTQFVCQSCGGETNKWQGQCPHCLEWNTLTEFKVSKKSLKSSSNKGYAGEASGALKSLSEIDLQEMPRITTGMDEFDRVLGGGLVPGSVILMGGYPGAGKSTLLLQTACFLSKRELVLYVTGEESLQQIALRAARLALTEAPHLKLLSETDVEQVVRVAGQVNPKVLIVDSIQVMQLLEISSAAGTVSQVRECAAYLTRFAKQTGTIIFLVGHVTKDGSLAGPKVLEHIIDCSILFESNWDSRFRTLRAQKNRFGAVNEIGVFAMLESGLRPVKNPSAIFLSDRRGEALGTVVTVLWEGTRALLVEIQALVDQGHGQPKRVAVGLDVARLSMLLAVLSRHAGLQLSDQDIFVNVVGGVKVTETSADLGVICALISSFRNQVIQTNTIFMGEVGLTGEIRPVPSGLERIVEAKKHGFTRAVIPFGNKPKQDISGIEVISCATLADAIKFL
jgi:DNA repair protein RadA/Sms